MEYLLFRADWETVEDGLGYCEEVREEMPYMGDTSILNLIDTAVFDFLMGGWVRGMGWDGIMGWDNG